MTVSNQTAIAATSYEPAEGCQLLYHPNDRRFLSNLACYVRSQLEVFVATPSDLTGRTRRGGLRDGVSVGRVGIRCIHCSPRRFSPHPGECLATCAMSFPQGLRLVHQTARNWQCRHFKVCPAIPDEVRSEFGRIKEMEKCWRKSKKRGGAQYWEDSCRYMGLIDTDDGVRLRNGAFLDRGSAEEEEQMSIEKRVEFIGEMDRRKTEQVARKKRKAMLQGSVQGSSEEGKVITEGAADRTSKKRKEQLGSPSVVGGDSNFKCTKDLVTESSREGNICSPKPTADGGHESNVTGEDTENTEEAVVREIVGGCSRSDNDSTAHSKEATITRRPPLLRYLQQQIACRPLLHYRYYQAGPTPYGYHSHWHWQKQKQIAHGVRGQATPVLPTDVSDGGSTKCTEDLKTRSLLEGNIRSPKPTANEGHESDVMGEDTEEAAARENAGVYSHSDDDIAAHFNEATIARRPPLLSYLQQQIAHEVLLRPPPVLPTIGLDGININPMAAGGAQQGQIPYDRRPLPHPPETVLSMQPPPVTPTNGSDDGNVSPAAAGGAPHQSEPNTGPTSRVPPEAYDFVNTVPPSILDVASVVAGLKRQHPTKRDKTPDGRGENSDGEPQQVRLRADAASAGQTADKSCTANSPSSPAVPLRNSCGLPPIPREDALLSVRLALSVVRSAKQARSPSPSTVVGKGEQQGAAEESSDRDDLVRVGKELFYVFTSCNSINVSGQDDEWVVGHDIALLSEAGLPAPVFGLVSSLLQTGRRGSHGYCKYNSLDEVMMDLRLMLLNPMQV